MKTVKVYLQDGYHYTTKVANKCTDEEIQSRLGYGAMIGTEWKQVERIEIY